MAHKAGFISFRFAGNDGVTLESLKWVEIFTRHNWQCYFSAGESNFPESHTMLFPEFHFNHPEILQITKECFASERRNRSLTHALHEMRKKMKGYLYEFIDTLDLDLLVLENILAIPMNLPLSMAVVEVLAETRIPAIAHHHDFYWERDRYRVNCIQDLLQGCFPPHISSVVHVTINSIAQQQLGYRTGVSSRVIPNIMEFEREAVGQDHYNASLREDLDIPQDALLVLQPTRIVQRKGIEHSIEIVRRLGDKAIMVVSHNGGDEGAEYQERILEFANMLGVDMRLAVGRIGDARGSDEKGKIYNLNDIYSCADLVTYPSILEGFGNALLEAVYFRKPIVVNRYPVYAADIKPKGFQCIEFDNFVSQHTIDMITRTLNDPQEIQRMVDINYDLALCHYSYSLLYGCMGQILQGFFGSADTR